MLSCTSPWLSAYTSFSRTWSPRAYEGFHTACALWLLSTVAARRVVLHLGKPFYTPLYIALVARSSLYSKSTTTAIALDTLNAAGLDWLLAPDNSTPRRFIRDLSLRLPDNFPVLPPEQQARVRNRLALTSRRGWFYDEFGQQLSSLNREHSAQADFRSLLRRLDDCKDSYELATFGRGSDLLQQPYLALLANLTPADMQRASRPGASLWNDGFWARFAFVCPSNGDTIMEGARFPDGIRAIPPQLSAPLRAWHERLGMPHLQIAPALDPSPSPTPTLHLAPSDPALCTLAAGVKESFYDYHDDLLRMARQNNVPDLDSSYARLAEKALRVAMLLASLENDNHIDLAHWSLAREIAESWRADLHTLYDQLAAPPRPAAATKEESVEDKLVAIVRKHPGLTANEVAHYISGLDAAEAERLLQELVFASRLSAYVKSRSIRYEIMSPLPDEEQIA